MDSGFIGRRVAARREARGWMQKDLASMLGCDPSKISNLERGARQRVDLDFLTEVAAALGASVADLMSGESADARDDSAEPVNMGRVMRALEDVTKAWLLREETERARQDNERLRLENDRIRTQQVDAANADERRERARERTIARESERELHSGLRLAIDELVRLSNPHGDRRREVAASRNGS